MTRTPQECFASHGGALNAGDLPRILEDYTEDAVLIFVALPGVDPEKVEVAIHNGVLLLAGERPLPAEARTAIIHRLELPQGRFERQVPLPPGRYEKPRSVVANGCLVIKLPKASPQRGRP